MSWLAQNNWVWLTVAAALGAILTWSLMVRRVAYVDTTVRRGAAGVGTHPQAPSARAAEPMAALEITETFEEGPGASVRAVERPAARLGESALGASLAGGAPAPSAAEDEIEIEEAEVELPVPTMPSGPYGEGSAEPLDGGASPGEDFTIKANADSMLYHTEDSPYYGRTVAEVWFDSESAARAAGFTRWDQR